MFFLLRMAFWIGVVCVLVPGASKDGSPIDAGQALTVATAAVSDARGFCDRQPKPGEELTVGMVDLKDGDRYIPLAASASGSRTPASRAGKSRPRSGRKPKPARAPCFS